MASQLVARGLYSLIASRDSSDVASFTKRDDTKKENALTAAWIVLIVANLALLVPLFFFLTYTLDKLYPTLAIVEADSPPEYQLVLDTDDNRRPGDSSISKNAPSVANNAFLPKGTPSTSIADEAAGAPSISSEPVTSEMIKTIRLIRKNGGVFKAFWWLFLTNIVLALVFGCISSIPIMPDFIASILATLAVTKMSTFWTIKAVSSQRDVFLWKSLPSYKVVFKATALPLIAQALIVEFINKAAIFPLGERTGSVENSYGILPRYANGNSGLSLSLTLLLAFSLWALFIVPTEVILTRVRASMISSDATTLVPLDSSIESQQVEDMGFQSWLHAWKTFSRKSWLRIVKVYAKIVAVTFVTEFAVMWLVFLEIFVVSIIAAKHMDSKNPQTTPL